MRTRSLLAIVLPILGMLVPTLGMAQAYKCVVDGRTTYQDAPCANAPSTPVDTTYSSGVTGLKQDADRMAAREAQAASAARNEAAREAAAKRKARFDKVREYKGREWYKENCQSKRTPAGRPSYGLDCN